MSYEASLKQKRDWESVLSTVRRTALQTGRKEERARAEAEKLESARKFKAMGMAIEDIAKGLGLSIEEVEKI